MSSPDTNNSNQNGRNVRQRGLDDLPRTFVPMDPSTFPVTQPKILSLDELKDPNVPRRGTGIYLQLLRIVSGSGSGGFGNQNSKAQYSFYNKVTRERSTTSFSRMFLFSDHLSPNGQVVYIIESKNQNEKLWMRNPTYRDDGNISIGSLILVLNPPNIKLLVGGEIPILDTRGGCFLIKSNFYQPTIQINYQVDENVARAFAVNDVAI